MRVKITLLRPELDAIRNGATALLFPDLPTVRLWKRGQKLISRRTKIAMTVRGKRPITILTLRPDQALKLGVSRVAVARSAKWASHTPLIWVHVKVEKP